MNDDYDYTTDDLEQRTPDRDYGRRSATDPQLAVLLGVAIVAVFLLGVGIGRLIGATVQ